MLWRSIVVAMLVVAGSCSAASGKSDLERSDAAFAEVESGSIPNVSDEPRDSGTTTTSPPSSIGRGLDLE